MTTKLAKEVSWSPMTRGGATIVQFRLREDASGALSFRPTVTAWLTAALLAVGSVASMGLAVWVWASDPPPPPWPVLAGALGGALMMVGAVGFGGHLTATRIFDPALGAYLASPGPSWPHGALETLDFAQIHAVQIIGEEVPIEGRYFTRVKPSYELNLVTGTGDRVQVVNQAGLDKVRHDAARIAKMVDAPVWDATRRGAAALPG